MPWTYTFSVGVTAVIPWGPGHAVPAALVAVLAAVPAVDEVVLVADGHAGEPVGGATVLSTGDVPKGPAFARNLGARQGKGEWVLFVDADVLLPPGWVDAALALAVTHDPAQVVGVVGVYGPDNRHGLLAGYKNTWLHYSYGRRPLTTGGLLSSALLLRRGAFEAVGGFDERYRKPSVEDTALGRKLLARGQVAAVLMQPPLHHRKTLTPTGFMRLTFSRAAGLAALGGRVGSSSVPTWTPLVMAVSAATWAGGVALLFHTARFGAFPVVAVPLGALLVVAVLAKDFFVVLAKDFSMGAWVWGPPLMMLEMVLAILGGVAGVLMRMTGGGVRA